MFSHIISVSVVVLIGLSLWTTSESKGEFRSRPFSFASYYGDHMVLQQAPRRANIWGYATNVNEEITVSLNAKASINTTSFIGPIPSTPVWSVLLPAVSAGGPYTITATSGEGKISLTDILFGDVWICSGQSNMQFTVSMGYNASYEIADAKNYPNIRVFTASLESSPVEEYDLLNVSEPWSVPSSETVGGGNWSYFSAVCWLYGKYLSKHLSYPIGLLSTSYWGTRVEAWTTPGVLIECGDVNTYKGNTTLDPNADSVLWNAMIHPLLNMTIYGALWYQGESNAMNASIMNLYNCTFPAMIDDWRKQFHAASKNQTDKYFPFGFVQLAPWRNNNSLTEGFPDIRWHQTSDYGYVPNDRMVNVFMAVAMDLPDFNSPWSGIHPRDKQDVAMRLCTAGLAVAYNQTQYSKLNGPSPSQITIWEPTGIMQIEYGNTTLDIRSADGFEVICIELANGTGNTTGWLPLPITSHDNTSVSLNYTKLCVQSKNTYIAAVRYAWRESPCAFKQCAIYNKESGYPAPPFYQLFIGDPGKVKIVKKRME